MANRLSRRYPLLLAAAALGTALSAAPAQAVVVVGHGPGVARNCYSRYQSGHWIWANGNRIWISGQYVRVCGR